MKRALILCTLLLSIILFTACNLSAADTSATVKNTPVLNTPTPTANGNPISDPIFKANYDSALSDARNCLNVLAVAQALEGIGTLDEGLIFVVTKENTEYKFVYSDGDLVYADDATCGTELAADYDGWLDNVKVYMP